MVLAGRGGKCGMANIMGSIEKTPLMEGGKS